MAKAAKVVSRLRYHLFCVWSTIQDGLVQEILVQEKEVLNAVHKQKEKNLQAALDDAAKGMEDLNAAHKKKEKNLSW